MKPACVAASLFLAGVFALPARSQPGPVAIRPDVLFIAEDDLRAELNWYGATHMRIPEYGQTGEGRTAL